jgi:AcrR family transcriptional regulator
MKKQNTKIRKEQIKKAALEIIVCEGIGKLSTRNLAVKVGISEGAIFRHFKTKQDIILSIIEDVKENMVGGMRLAAAQKNPADKRLFDMMCVQIKYILNNQGVNILLFSEAVHYDDSVLKKELRKILDEQKKLLTGVIKDGIKEGIFDKNINIEDASMFYLGIPITLNIELVLNRSKLNTESFCRRMLSLFFKVLGGMTSYEF